MGKAKTAAAITPQTFDFSDKEIAKCFQRAYGEDFIYDTVESKWFVWGETMWLEDVGGKYYTAKMEALAERIRRASDFNPKLKSKNKGSTVHTKCDNLTTPAKLASVKGVLEGYLSRRVQWNNHPYTVTFLNGVYDLQDKTFRNSRRKEYINDTVTTKYNYEKPDPEKMKFLRENFINRILPDKAERERVMHTLASGMIGEPSKDLHVFHGSGSNGKSALMDFMGTVLGDYYVKVDKEVYRPLNIQHKR